MMEKLIYLGSLALDLTSAHIIAGIGRLLGSETFTAKAKIKSEIKWKDYYVSIDEMISTASLKSKQKYGDDFHNNGEKKTIKDLTLDEIKSFRSYEGGYILPFSIITHACDSRMLCPTCGGSGQCPDCEGVRYVNCDVCEGEKSCSSCSGSGKYPCYSCNQTGTCGNCDGSGSEECDDCDGGYVDCEDCDGDGTIECEVCNGKGWTWNTVECRACHGSGRYWKQNLVDVQCRKCRGTGEYRIGRVDCDECDGDGDVTCNTCGGDGTLYCNTCDGNGEIECHKCGGNGICPKCNGAGNVECRACRGSGKCGKCRGKGKLRCQTCNASGACPRCSGTGSVTCTICHGTGSYQTFDILKLNKKTRKLGFDSTHPEVIGYEGLKRELYQSSPFKIEFSKVAIEKGAMFTILEILNECGDKELLNKILEYKDSLIDSKGHSKIEDNKCIVTKIVIESHAVTKLDVRFSNEDFIFYILGEHKAVYCDRKPSRWDRFCAALF